MYKNPTFAAWGLAVFLTSIVPGLIPTAEAVRRGDVHPECRDEELPAAPLLTDKELIGKYFTMSDIYTNDERDWVQNP